MKKYPSLFFRKMLLSAFLLRFKANYLENKMRGIPSFLFVDSNSSCKDLFSPHDPNLAQKPLYLVGTVLNFDPRRTLSFFTIIWSVTPPTVSNINKCSQIYGGGQIKLVVTRFQKARKRTELRANAKNKEQREKVR